MFAYVTTNMPKEEDSIKWTNICLKTGATIGLYPIEYAKSLIQMGYEPMKPYETKTLFGRPALALPNVFKYVSYIKTIDGITGCYRGVTPWLSGIVVANIVGNETTKYLGGDKYLEEKDDDDDDLSEKERLQKLFNKASITITAHSVGIVASQPFKVIAYRMMAQFVGGEDKYSGILSSFGEIYRENGIGGFFSGVVPRLLAEISTVALVSTLGYLIRRFLFDEKEMKTVVSSLASFLATTVTHPFYVVSTCMSVADSGLAAGKPPHMPVYTSWIHCWCHLSETRQLKRGSTLLWRYYTGPYTLKQLPHTDY